MARLNDRMRYVHICLAVIVIVGFTAVTAAEDRIAPTDTLQQALEKLPRTKAVVELPEASIIIEVNETDGDAGFQVFLDGEGWRHARVFDPQGRQIFQVHVSGGIRDIGGGTELFMETEEPEYEDLDELQELIELLDEGEYTFMAKLEGGETAIGTADLTHVVPAGPELVTPVPAEEECATDVLFDMAVIEWYPVTTQITGDPGIVIEAYQVIVENEDTELEFIAEVPADVTMVTVPPEFLEPGTEYAFEVLAIEESGNQTITESCFETAD